ncbi:MAG: cupin domain-containing protein [Chloroflexi bacterium]|nr:MAG: cupin domain-containing protein [Chloroflexota bacterium]MBL1194902.1 cupin domain-containing protein [Chloroflexota bacterium]NOH12193.1 cupin domain-containing protein [Chloroflexota bacterium]
MKLFRFDADIGQPIELYDSKGLTITRIIEPTDCHVSTVCMHIEPKGVVGFHQAVYRQLFMVVNGEGWVTGDDQERHPIKAGQAALWEAEEWHESGSDSGMMVFVVEGDEIRPEDFLAPV